MTVIHAVGPDFRRPRLTDNLYDVNQAIGRLTTTYYNIFTEFLKHVVNKDGIEPKLRLLPVSSEIFSGELKDYMPIITSLAILNAINKLETDTELFNRLNSANVGLYIHHNTTPGEFALDAKGYELLLNKYKIAFGFKDYTTEHNDDNPFTQHDIKLQATVFSYYYRSGGSVSKVHDNIASLKIGLNDVQKEIDSHKTSEALVTSLHNIFRQVYGENKGYIELPQLKE